MSSPVPQISRYLAGSLGRVGHPPTEGLCVRSSRKPLACLIFSDRASGLRHDPSLGSKAELKLPENGPVKTDRDRS